MATSSSRAIPAKGEKITRSSVAFLVPNEIEPSTSLDGYGHRPGLDNLLFELGVEPSMTVYEAASILRWSYWKARRYFSQVEGICVSCRPKRYKRPYRTFTIPVSIFAREWQKMTGHEAEAAEVIRQRLALAIQK